MFGAATLAGCFVRIEEKHWTVVPSSHALSQLKDGIVAKGRRRQDAHKLITVFLFVNSCVLNIFAG